MPPRLSYPEALAVVDSTITKGIKLGLENTERLLAALGHPHRGLRCLHVAGTNGKGSICALLASTLTAAGYRTGLNTSPHLVNVRERVRVDGVSIPVPDFCECVAELQDAIRRIQQEQPEFAATHFEFVTVLALLYFAKVKTDFAVIEVGMGGRLDSTNVITPLVSVICTIDFDHTRALGTTLSAIAGEKAGIIKPGVPVICGDRQPEVVERVSAVAAERGAPLWRLGVDFDALGYQPAGVFPHLRQQQHLRWRTRRFSLETRLLGGHQNTNAAIAAASLGGLRETGVPLPDTALADGFARAVWPARLQILPDGLLLDGAHNAGGMAALRQALAEFFPGRRWTVMFGVMQDKAWRAMLDNVAAFARQVYVVPVKNARAAPPEVLLDYARKRWPGLRIAACDDVASGMQRLRQEGAGLVAGSLYLAGEVLAEYTRGEPADLVGWD